jgi:hypothetical protein
MHFGHATLNICICIANFYEFELFMPKKHASDFFQLTRAVTAERYR